MTLPGKLEPGLKGFPTPNDVPEDVGYIVFYFPNSNDWAGLLLGAVKELTHEYNFYQWGELTPDEAAEAWKDIVTAAPYNLLPSSVPTPFWDTDDDVDDELPVDAQPWYGYVADPTLPADELTFVEQAGIWGITGFLAFATFEVGFAPAILFHTIAPKFALAFRRGDVGELIRIVVDGVELSRVDTTPAAAGDVVRVQVIADPEIEEHALLLVQES